MIAKALPGILLAAAASGVTAWVWSSDLVLAVHTLSGVALLLGSIVHAFAPGQTGARRTGAFALLAVALAFATGLLAGDVAILLHASVASLVAGVAVYVHITRRPDWRRPRHLAIAALVVAAAMLARTPISTGWLLIPLMASVPVAAWAYLRNP